MAILAIDPSLTETGFCYDTPQGAGQTYGVIKPKTRRGTARLDFIHMHLYSILDDRPVEKPIRWAVMEGYNYGAARGRGSPGRAFEIGELGGMIKIMMQDLQIPLLIVPPASLKMFVTGNGIAEKSQMRGATYQQWGVLSPNDNIVDAIGLYYFMQAFLSARKRRGYSAKQKQALKGAAYDLAVD